MGYPQHGIWKLLSIGAYDSDAAGNAGAALWSLPGDDGREVRLETELKGHKGAVKAVEWHPSEESCLATVSEGELRVWDVTGASAQVNSTFLQVSQLMK
jgi:WD40 repeat protein